MVKRSRKLDLETVKETIQAANGELTQNLEAAGNTEAEVVMVEKEAPLQGRTIQEEEEEKIKEESKMASNSEISTLKEQLRTSELLVSKLTQDLQAEKEVLLAMKEIATQRILEEKKTASIFREMVAESRDEISALIQQVETIGEELFDTKKQLNSAEQKGSDLAQKLKVAEEQKSSQAIKFAHTLTQYQNIQNTIDGLTVQSTQLDDDWKGLSSVVQKNKEQDVDSLNRIKELEHRLTELEFVIEAAANTRRALITQVDTKVAEARQLTDENGRLQARIMELDKAADGREAQLSALTKKLEEYERDSSAKVTELQVRFQNKVDENSQLLTQIERLKEELLEKYGLIKELTMEMETLGNQKNDVEAQLRTRNEEVGLLRDEMASLQGKVCVMDKTMSERGLQFAALQEKHSKRENEVSTEIMTLKEHAKDLQRELDSLQTERNLLQSQLEGEQNEFSGKIAEMENGNARLVTRVADLQRLLNEQAEGLNNQLGCMDETVAELREKLQSLEGEVELKDEELRSLAWKNKEMEFHLAGLSEKCWFTEQELKGTVDNFKRVEAKYKEEQRELDGKISVLLATMAANNDAHLRMVTDLWDKLLTITPSLDTLPSRFEEDCNRYRHRVVELSQEILIAKDWVMDINQEREKLKEQVNRLGVQLQHSREDEASLKNKVVQLLALVRNEVAEKLNLTKAISLLESKLAAMEMSLKEKDEGMTSLVVEKRESIRQLFTQMPIRRQRAAAPRECPFFLISLV